jgi:hypothetical protein
MIIPTDFFDNILDNVRPADNKSSLSKKSQSGPVHERYRYGGYGVAGSSKAATTPTNPIVISSSDENDDDNKTPIKKKNNRKPDENEDGKTKKPIKKKDNKKHKKQQKKRKRSISHSSFEESDKSDDGYDPSAPRRTKYLHSADLPKDLRDALRVSRSFV